MQQVQNQTSKGNIVFYQLDRQRRETAATADLHYNKKLTYSWTPCYSWETLADALSTNPEILIFDTASFSNSQPHIIEFVNLLRTMFRLMGCTTAKIAVCVNQNSSKQLVEQLKAAGVSGLFPGCNWLGLDTSTPHLQSLIDNEEHWPEDIILRLPDLNKKQSIGYYTQNSEFDQNCLTGNLSDINATFSICRDLKQLSAFISQCPELLVIDSNLINKKTPVEEIIQTIYGMARLNDAEYTTKIALTVAKDTDQSIIKRYSKLPIQGIVPVDFGIDEILMAIHLMTNNSPCWPRHIIDRLPNQNKKKKSVNKTLTVRQQQIFDLIARRGISNKQIARMLCISESTVKIHVSAVMKHLCVRNRTQLALTKI